MAKTWPNYWLHSIHIHIYISLHFQKNSVGISETQSPTNIAIYFSNKLLSIDTTTSSCACMKIQGWSFQVWGGEQRVYVCPLQVVEIGILSMAWASWLLTRASCYDVPSWKLVSVAFWSRPLCVLCRLRVSRLQHPTKIFSHDGLIGELWLPLPSTHLSQNKRKRRILHIQPPTSSCISFGSNSHEWVRSKALGEGEGV